MTFRRSDNGTWYGTIECLMIRVVGDETETVIGTRSPWGGIMAELDGKRFVEKPADWWESQGFTITMPEIWHEARYSCSCPYDHVRVLPAPVNTRTHRLQAGDVYLHRL